MNRRGFIASLFALPAALKSLVTDFKLPQSTSPVPQATTLELLQEANLRFETMMKPVHDSASNIIAGDLVWLTDDGKLTNVTSNPSNVLGVAVNCPKDGKVEYLMDGKIWKGDV